MDYSGDIAIALEQLRMTNVRYCEASNTMKGCKENRAVCFKDFRALGNQLSDTGCKRKALDEAIMAEKMAEEYLGTVTKELRAKQSAYDKIKLLAASAKRAQKDSETREKQRWEKIKEQNKQKWEEQQKLWEESERVKSEAENARERAKKEKQQEEDAKRKFWKDGYEEGAPPKSSRRPRNFWQIPRPTSAQAPTSPSKWKQACDEILNDRSKMTAFPDPPHSGCVLVSCTASRDQRALKACQCDIAKALQRDPQYPKSLKAERLRWHPDKFNICPEGHRATFQAMAKEIFVVANHLYERDGNGHKEE